MSAFPHAEKFIEVNQILAKGGAITTLDRATISAFVASLVHEVADKSDALEHFAAENQRLVDVYNHALKKNNEQRGAANDLRDQLAEKEDALQHFATENQRLVDAQKHALMSLQGGVEESSEPFGCSPSYTMVTHADDEGVADDCSPIPRSRQEAAEPAKNTDADGKPLPSKDSDGDECSDGLQLRFFRRGAGGEKVEIDAPDSWGNTDDSEEDEDDESDSDMVADDEIPSPSAAEAHRRRLGAFDPKDPFGVQRDGIRTPVESDYDDEKEKARQAEVLKEFIRIKRLS